MDKECGARISGIIAENQQAHQVVASEREELLSLTSRKSKPVRLLDRHGDRDYKVPFVQLLPSPQGEELSLRSISLDSGLHASLHSSNTQTTLSDDSLSAREDVNHVMSHHCFRLKQTWVASPEDALRQQQHRKVMEEMTLKRSLCSHDSEGKSVDLERPTSISLEGELVCLQKMINHQLQEMSATMEKTLCSLIEQQKLSEMDYLEQKQQITKLVAEVAELKEKNQTLLKEKHQLLEEQTKMKQQLEVVNAKAEVYREDFETERGDREKAVAQKEQYRSEMLTLQKQLQQAKDILVQND